MAPGPRRTAVDVFNSVRSPNPGLVALRHKRAGEWRPTPWASEPAHRTRSPAASSSSASPAASGSPSCRPPASSGRCATSVCSRPGGVVVPIYASSLPEQCEYILRDSGSVIAIAEDARQLDKLLAVRARCPT